MRALAICIEDLDRPRRRYTRCVALKGRQPGLYLDPDGQVRWQDEDTGPVACHLWISLDERLVLFRPTGAAPSRLLRGGRSLDVPRGKPVVLVDGDEVAIGSRRLRLHLHGETSAVSPPAPLVPAPEPRSRLATRAAVTAIALGAAFAGGDCKVSVPPAHAPPASARPDISAPDTRVPDAGGGQQGRPASQPIEVRDRPPVPPPPRDGCNRGLDDGDEEA